MTDTDTIRFDCDKCDATAVVDVTEDHGWLSVCTHRAPTAEEEAKQREAWERNSKGLVRKLRRPFQPQPVAETSTLCPACRAKEEDDAV